ncbi:MAG: uracil-DNA glycosylase family protein, partial [Candidatus Odinarchaeota archaeon]
ADFIGKTPAPISVEKGHYFQGKQGKMFWNKLIEYDILSIRTRTYEDENLIENNYGITDIVKEPKPFGLEPTNEEYQSGLKKIEKIIEKYKADVIVFVYKKVLDNILKMRFNFTSKSNYGMNSNLDDLLGAKVFVFPMPGTPCSKQQLI